MSSDTETRRLCEFCAEWHSGYLNYVKCGHIGYGHCRSGSPDKCRKCKTEGLICQEQECQWCAKKHFGALESKSWCGHWKIGECVHAYHTDRCQSCTNEQEAKEKARLQAIEDKKTPLKRKFDQLVTAFNAATEKLQMAMEDVKSVWEGFDEGLFGDFADEDDDIPQAREALRATGVELKEVQTAQKDTRVAFQAIEKFFRDEVPKSKKRKLNNDGGSSTEESDSE